MTRGAFCVLLLALPPAGCLVTFDDEAPADVPGLDAVMRLDEEPAGERCPAGGVVVVTGTDGDGDGTLDPAEESGVVSVVCAGQGGAPAKVVLLRIVAEPEGGACPYGGQRVESGLDDDADDVLDDEEVESARTLCNGAPGAVGGQALVEVADEPAGERCAAGGARVRSGIDQDGDTALDEEEVAATAWACHGEEGGPGAPGSDGSDALVDVVTELPGLACPAGGQRVSMGLDVDDDGALDEDERTSTSYVCNGRSLSTGGGGELSGGSSEGSADSPVELTVGSFARDETSHVGTVGAERVSYYHFTTLADPAADASAPYTLAFHDVEADVAVAVYAGADFSTGPVVVDCAFERSRLFVCGTERLIEGTPYYVSVTETRNIALGYALTVSFGARTGTVATPASPSTAVSVHGGGSSFFDVGGAPGELRTVRLENVRGPPGTTPALVWDQLDDGNAAPPYGTCASAAGGDIVCPTARLGAGTLIGVRDSAGLGAVFDLVVEDGDTLTPALPLESFEDVAAPLGVMPVVALPTSGAGPYTLAFRRAAGTFSSGLVTLYPDRLSVEADVRRIGACGADCIVTLPEAVASGFVYLRLPTRMAGEELPHTVALYPRGGDQGAQGAPFALPAGTLVEGSVGSMSRYSLPAPAVETRYAVRVDTGGFGTNVSCRWSEGAAFTSDLYLYTFPQSNVPIDGCISEPLPAGQPAYFYLSTSSSKPVAYTLEALEGDTITPVLTVGGGIDTVVGENRQVFRQLPSLAPGPYAISTTATGSVRRRVFPGFPRNFDVQDDHVARCEGSSSGSGRSDGACTLRFVAAASVDAYYVDLLPFTQTITLDAVALPVAAHAVGTPAAYTIAAGEVLWLEIDVASEGAFELDVTQTVSGSYAWSVYSSGYEERVFRGSVFSPAGSVATQELGTLSTGRWAIEIDPSGSSVVDVTVDVREVP